ncbi:hypothetical protein GCM10007047_16270 [Cerasicoccus arenae]|uniref:Uncharacterized protein n=2 Tax=Cerasicoccus arenae TaxID=424488 RepID=A0A8J3DFJ4_9BACT|nr:hypothetical protein GCM10007047_16270 [Cerasicoccus arenae]
MEKFVQEPGVVGFTEPFNEHLRLIDQKMADEDDQKRREELNHPNQEQSYYGPYRDLIVPGDIESPGIRHFDIRYPLNYWFDPKDRGQLRYLRSLIDHAGDRFQSQPVLGFVRSLGRVELLRNLGGYHIVLLREPFDAFWSSYTQLRDKTNAYFAVQYVMLAALCRDVPALDALALKYHLPKLKIKGPFYTYGRACNLFREQYADNLELLREAFCLVYLLSYGAALPHADLVVSVDRLSRDEAYRKRISNLIAENTGRVLDFNDCRCPQYDEPEARAAFEETYRAEQCALEESRQARWMAGGRLLDSLLA